MLVMIVLLNAFLPTTSLQPGNLLAGRNLKRSSNFWHRIWSEAGCPSSGVLFQIKKHTKSRYKHQVRRLKRKQNSLLQEKLAGLSARKKMRDFWSQIRKLNVTRSPSSPVVDGLSDSRALQIFLHQNSLMS